MRTNAAMRNRMGHLLALAATSGLWSVACSDQDSAQAGHGGSVTLAGGASGAGGAGTMGGVGGSGAGATGAGGGGAMGGAGASGAGGQAAGSGGGLSLDVPLLLSETGLYADLQREQLSPDVLPYEVQYPLWSDGAKKRRYLSLPAGTRIDTDSMDHWILPVGTTAWKEFVRNGTRVETRMLRKRAEGWQFVAYVWRDDLSDADAAPAGVSDARGTPHDVPSSEQCVECHRTGSSVLGAVTGLRFLGLSAIQLSRPGGGALAELANSDRLTRAPAQEFSAPGDAEIAAGLGYLHGNCGSCHSSSHPIGSKVSMVLELTTAERTLEQTGFYSTAIGHSTNHVILGTSVRVQLGQPAASQLFVRMGIRDLEQMPPLGTELVDATGLAAVSNLILALPPP